MEHVTKSTELTLEGKGKTGEISLTLHGMNVNMTKFPKKNHSRNAQSHTNGAYRYVENFIQINNVMFPVFYVLCL